MGSYSEVHCERTRRRVMEDLPQPPSPQIVMEMGIAGWGAEELWWKEPLCAAASGSGLVVAATEDSRVIAVSCLWFCCLIQTNG